MMPDHCSPGRSTGPLTIRLGPATSPRPVAQTFHPARTYPGPGPRQLLLSIKAGQRERRRILPLALRLSLELEVVATARGQRVARSRELLTLGVRGALARTMPITNPWTQVKGRRRA